MKAAISRSLLAVLLVAAAAQPFEVDVPAPDGTPLATSVYLPLFGSPWPVVLARTPYGKNDLATACTTLNLLGLACVAQDMRGLGESGGELDSVFRHDGEDGRATLDWIVAQDWCDGSIATLGASALGIVQYALAPGAGPHLACTMPVVATPDLYHHAFFQGGCIREELARVWLVDLGLESYFDEISQHRLWDSWWQEADILSRVGSVTAPGLHVGGWYDIFSQGTLDAFTTFQREGGEGAAGRQYLVMGPWTHGGLGQPQAGELQYPDSAGLDLFELAWDWVRYWLRGEESGVDKWPAVRVYLMGAVGEEGAPGNRWLELAGWPPPSRDLTLFLASDGVLSAETPAPGEVELVIDPDDPVPTLGGANLHPDLEVDGRPMGDGPADQRPVEVRSDVLTFTTTALDEPAVILGRVRARLWVLPDTRDLDLSVRLCDVYPDGRSMLVLDGIQRASMRCGDERECFLTPGEPTLVEVDLWSTALAVATGHRIRIDVAGSNSPRFEVNSNRGDLGPGEPIVARPRLLLGPDHPSALLLPVGDVQRRPTGRLTGG